MHRSVVFVSNKPAQIRQVSVELEHQFILKGVKLILLLFQLVPSFAHIDSVPIIIV